jgi:hypothetical protein
MQMKVWLIRDAKYVYWGVYFRRLFWPTGVNIYAIRVSLRLLIDNVISLHMTLYIVVAIFNFMLQI